MNAKRSLMAAIVGIATMIAMPLAANAGGHYADSYENTQWQAPAAVMQVGHHNGWRDSGQYNSGVVCDQDGDDCRPAVNRDADRDDCAPSSGYGYQGQYNAPSYRGRAYDNNNYDYNSGYGRGYSAPAYNNYGYGQQYSGAYNAPYGNNGAYGGLSTLAPLLQQFVR
jgi:hypothetical protein